MAREPDSRRLAGREGLTWLAVLACGLLLVGLGVWLLPLLWTGLEMALAPGLGLRQAAVVAFFVVVGLFVLFALVAGDSLIGEIQFMIGGFLLFYLVFTLMIAWVF